MNNVRNTEGLENYFYSFAPSIAKISGSNFIDTEKDVKLILKTSIASFDITKTSNWNLTSSSEIYFRFPNVTELYFAYDLKYPFNLNLGLSLTGGSHYEYAPVNYLATCKSFFVINF